MSGEDHFRPTTRKNPVNIIPDPETALHRPGGRCWCEPQLEEWRMGTAVTYRLIHRSLAADPCGAPVTITGLRLGGGVAVSCKKPRGHASTRHEDRDAEGRLIAEWMA